MKTQEIIVELRSMNIEGDKDYDKLDRIDEPADILIENPDGHLACEELMRLLERNSEINFGSPGMIAHIGEKFPGYYECQLIDSLDRQSTAMTRWMLNRIINAASGEEKLKLIDKLLVYAVHPRANEEARVQATDFYKFQNE
jgi:hypothetical protein